jgi:PAS domain S-box-containing protein
MAETNSSREVREENRVLRARVAELEQELARLRNAGGLADASEPGRTAAERAISGFFEQPLVMLFIADLVEGRYLRVNGKVCEVLGFTEREILESSFLERVHPDDHVRTVLEMGRLAAGERTAGFRNRHLDANGRYHTFEWTAIADADRELCYAMAVEITE